MQIDFTNEQLEQIAQVQKYYLQFMRIVNQDIFDKKFTGKVILDIHQGNVKNLQKITNFRFEINV